MSITDHRIASTDEVRSIALVVGDALAHQRLARDAHRRPRLGVDDERELARSIVVHQLDGLASQRIAAGHPPLDHGAEGALVESVLAAVLGLGRIQPLLDDPQINDIHIRGCAATHVKLIDGRRAALAPVVDSDAELIDLVRIAAARMGHSERRFDAAEPHLNLQLADGSRLFAVMDVSARPSVIIRRHRFELSSLAELAERGLVDDTLRDFLATAVRARRNIVIAGGTGSGKTTLLRALLNEAAPSERIVTIEDAFELGLDRFEAIHPDYDMLQSRPTNVEGRGEISMLELTRMALRMDPDRVIVGEVRGGEAFPMLMAMSQGNNGSMCTMHADSTQAVLPKLAAYVSMADTGLPIETVNLLIASAVHFVISIDVVDGVRRLSSVRELVDADGSRIISNEVFAPGVDGRAVESAPLRSATRALFDAHTPGAVRQ